MEAGLQSGDIFEGKYRVLGKLGEGGFATVFLAEHVDLGHRVAIKLLHRTEAEARFVREGKILASLRSPYTVRVLDFGRTDDGVSYLVSEYVEGVPLSSVIARGPMPWSEVEPRIRQLLMALREAHEHGVVHRDLKPDNVMQLPDGSIRTLDFGIAKVAVEDLTKSGAVIGTVRYMAPENLTGSRHVTPAVDVFAVGLLAQALLTGERPFESYATADIVKALLADAPFTLPAEVDVPSQVRRWIEHLLCKDAERRPGDAGEALVLLDEVVAELAEDVPSPRSAVPASVLLVGVFVLVLGLGVAWLHTQRAPVAEPTNESVSVEQPAPQLSSQFQDAVARFEYGDWLGALRLFDKLEPTASERTILEEKRYIQRAIDEVLEQEPSAETQRDIRELLKLRPDHEAAKQRLRDVTAELKRRERQRKVRRTTTTTPGQPAPARSFDDLTRLR